MRATAPICWRTNRARVPTTSRASRARTSSPATAATYWPIPAIRNGTKPRPEHYERIYRDVVAGVAQADQATQTGLAAALALAALSPVATTAAPYFADRAIVRGADRRAAGGLVAPAPA